MRFCASWFLTGRSGQTERGLQPPSAAGQQGPRDGTLRRAVQEERGVSDLGDPHTNRLWVAVSRVPES